MQHHKILATWLALLTVFPVSPLIAREPVKQIALPWVERMPNVPQPFRMIDWKARAGDFDRLAFNPVRAGKYLPLLQFNERPTNIIGRSFSLPSYVGSPGRGEAITCLGAVVSGTLVGIDKSRQCGHDWVTMCQDWFNEKSGQRVVLNNPWAPPAVQPGTTSCPAQSSSNWSIITLRPRAWSRS